MSELLNKKVKNNKNTQKNQKNNTNTSKNKEKFVFLIDIDGTLVNSGENDIDPIVVETIVRLKKQGHIFVLSTGRALSLALELHNIEIFDYAACLLGCEVFSIKEQRIIKQPTSLNTQEIEKLICLMKTKGRSWSYKDEKYSKTYSKEEKFARRHANMRITEADFLQDLKNGKVYQILLDKYLTEEEKNEFKHLTFFDMPHDYTDVAGKGLSKRVAVEYFQHRYNKRKTVAIGDSMNDIDMMLASDISIAMGNAKPEVKEKATYTTKDINEGGLVYALEDILRL